jgi:hypothetical protein
VKRGNISAEEDEIIVKLHASLGNRLVHDPPSNHHQHKIKKLLFFPLQSSQPNNQQKNQKQKQISLSLSLSLSYKDFSA